jgi:tripartite-type tricarboxylate transporter receptor subunit TctC
MPGLAANLHRPIELEFRPGESGAIAARTVAAATPDGNTLMMATLGTHALIPASNPACGYDPLTDFTPISLLLKAPLILVVPSTSEIRNIAALVDAARVADPPLTYGSSAFGGAPHIAAELFARRAGVNLRHVRYSDTRELYADLLAGKIDLSFNNLMSLLPLIREKQLIALGTTDLQSHPTIPDVPPIVSAGLSDYILTNWVGIVGPAKIDRQVVAELCAALEGAAAHAPEITPGNAELFQAHLTRELHYWSAIIGDLQLVNLT